MSIPHTPTDNAIAGPAQSSQAREDINDMPTPTHTTQIRRDTVNPGNSISSGGSFAAEFRNVRLPTFWKNRPKLWFVQLESELSAYRIRSDEQKYNAIIRHLDEATMIAVADVLENPPEEQKYERLKEALVSRLSDSHEKQLHTLLHGVVLGDKKPSQLLREMRSLAGANATDDLLRTLWLERLPARIQELLLIFDNENLEKLAECADKLKDRSAAGDVTTISAVKTTKKSEGEPLQQLAQQITELTTQVRTLIQTNKAKSYNRRRSRSRQRQAKEQDQTDVPAITNSTTTDQCYYHKRFGNLARKCTPPCSNSANPSTTKQGN